MKYSLIFFLCISLSNGNLYAQGTKKVDPAKIDQKLVHSLFLNILNKHRDSLGLRKLEENKILGEAAKCQSDYVATTAALTHNQPDKLKATVGNRVELMKGNFDGAGENLLFMPAIGDCRIKDKTYKITNYSELANCLFLFWRYSPGHYKNMITPDFEWSGFQVTYSPTNKLLYAANVFGGREYKSPKPFPLSFNIGDVKPDVHKLYADVAGELFSISAVNFIYKKEDSTLLYHHDLERVKSVLKYKSDGIMVDYVLREQFACGAENNLNNSPIYDGWPQNPIFVDQLFKGNRLAKYDKFYAYLAPVPAEVKNLNYQTNVIVIKDKIAINYTVPIDVMSSNFKILDFKPVLDTTGINKIDTVISFKVVNRIYFNKNTDVPIEDDNEINSLLNDKYLPEDASIKNVKIVGYSSIEGDSSKNQVLQIKRVNYLKRKLLFTTKIDTLLMSVSTDANIKDFIQDFGHLFNNDSLSLNELRAIYKQYPKEMYEYKLALHRYSQITFEVSVPLNSKTSNNGLQFLFNNINVMDEKTKLQLLKLALVRMQKNEESDIHMTATAYTWLKDPKYLLPLYYYTSDSANFRAVYKENLKKKTWSQKDKYNFIISNFRYYQTYDKPFIPLQQLVTYLPSLTRETVSDTVKKLIELNYYLIKADYSREIKKENEVTYALEKFKKIYDSFNPDVNDIVKIGLFFNHFNRYSWTLNLLKPKLSLYLENKKLWFTYFSTYTFLKYGNYDDFAEILIDKCLALDKWRLCDLIDKNFQLMRIPLFKKKYCAECVIEVEEVKEFY